MHESIKNRVIFILIVLGGTMKLGIKKDQKNLIQKRQVLKIHTHPCSTILVLVVSLYSGSRHKLFREHWMPQGAQIVAAAGSECRQLA